MDLINVRGNFFQFSNVKIMQLTNGCNRNTFRHIAVGNGENDTGGCRLELEGSKESKSRMSELSDVIELECCGGLLAFS